MLEQKLIFSLLKFLVFCLGKTEVLCIRVVVCVVLAFFVEVRVKFNFGFGSGWVNEKMEEGGGGWGREGGEGGEARYFSWQIRLSRVLLNLWNIFWDRE